MTSQTNPNSTIPHINFLFMQPTAKAALQKTLAARDTPPNITYTIYDGILSQLDPALEFDLVVSPANSYGILDGSFDDAISRAWSPPKTYMALTRHVQVELYDKYRGFLAPGSCHIVRMPDEWREKRMLRYGLKNGWEAKYIAMCPTMRTPSDCTWDHEVVYECIWNLWCAIDRHNRAAEEGNRIKSILMTPLATGVGGVSVEKWAEQAVLATEHFIEATEKPNKWSAISWGDLPNSVSAVNRTHDM